MQTRQTTMMQRIVECMKNNDLSQLAYAPFSNRNMQRLASDMSEALKNIHIHLDEEEAKHLYYENLLNKVDTAVIVCHPNGQIDRMNKAALHRITRRANKRYYGTRERKPLHAYFSNVNCPL